MTVGRIATARHGSPSTLRDTGAMVPPSALGAHRRPDTSRPLRVPSRTDRARSSARSGSTRRRPVRPGRTSPNGRDTVIRIFIGGAPRAGRARTPATLRLARGGRGPRARATNGPRVFSVKYFCRSTSTISCRFARLLLRRRTVRWALLRVLKTQKTKRRERLLGNVHGVR